MRFGDRDTASRSLNAYRQGSISACRRCMAAPHPHSGYHGFAVSGYIAARFHPTDHLDGCSFVGWVDHLNLGFHHPEHTAHGDIGDGSLCATSLLVGTLRMVYIGETADIDKTEYQQIFHAIKGDKQAVLVSGGAGTGKTTFIEYLATEEGRNDLPFARHSVVIAPTGTAALRAGGVTVHSFLQFPPETYDYEMNRFAGGERIMAIPSKKEIFGDMKLLIIDEVSMVRADLMDAIDRAFRINRGVLDQPFGGIQILFIGDLFQLQPVVTSFDGDFLHNRYPESSGMYFYDSNVIREMMARDRLAFVELRIPHRFRTKSAIKTRAGKFALMLNRLRQGDTRDIGEFNRYLAGRTRCEQLQKEGAVLLAGRRRTVDEYNRSKLDKLPGKEYGFEGLAEGKCEDFGDDRLPVPTRLPLKEGAQVIFVRNDQRRRWHNGSLARVTQISNATEESIEVELFRNGKRTKVEREEWEMKDYRYDSSKKEIQAEVVGTYTHFPLVLAWALTIHKAQGQTLDRTVIDMEGGAFSAGQAYVALSRCREAKNMGFLTPLRARDIISHQEVENFYRKLLALG